MTQAPARLMTAEELAELPDHGRWQYELVRGTLICMAPSFSRPAIVGSNIGMRVGSFVQQHRLGLCGGADWGFLLFSDPDSVRAPDFAFVRADRVLAEGIPDSFWPGAPDLAIEVVSPSDRFRQVMEKVKDYLDGGTRMIWAIDPEARTAIMFHRESGRVTFIDQDGTLDGEAVLPGFSLRLRDVLV
jgi:Uma2 family endonuclease